MSVPGIKPLLQKILKSAVAGSTSTASFDPPASVVRVFDITQQQWRILLDKKVESTTLVNTGIKKDEFSGFPTGESETQTVTGWTTLAEVLEELATQIVRPISEEFFDPGNERWLTARREDIRSRRRQGEWRFARAGQKKEVENSLQSRKTETSETSRAETTIVQKAQNKTNFRMSAEGGVTSASPRPRARPR